jgi:sentrin-specific protease 8
MVQVSTLHSSSLMNFSATKTSRFQTLVESPNVFLVFKFTMRKTSRVRFKDEVDSTESTVLVYRDVRLTKNDGWFQNSWFLPQTSFSICTLVALLGGPFWLNDQIIAFYFQYLESDVFKDHLTSLQFISPAVTQLIKMSPAEDTRSILKPLDQHRTKKLSFFAVNDNESAGAGGTHWSLLVFSKSEQTFFNFDSVFGQNRPAAKKLADLLTEAFNCPTAIFQDHDCTQQTNSHDCGIHLLANAEHIANFFLETGVVKNVPQVTQQAIKNTREKFSISSQK